ncbi:hypothetical protein N7527_009408 [Penicillium freii]|nr:hypothetical protein N7527_009408 [Penicillium freii]
MLRRSRSEIGGQETEEENCKEEDEDINRNVVIRKGVKSFHLDLGHDVTIVIGKGTNHLGTGRAEAAVKLICWNRS